RSPRSRSPRSTTNGTSRSTSSRSRRNSMQKLLLVGWIGAFLSAAAAYPLAGLIGSSSTEAYLIAAHDPKRVVGAKELFNLDPPKAPKDSPEYRKAVIGIYGT